MTDKLDFLDFRPRRRCRDAIALCIALLAAWAVLAGVGDVIWKALFG